MFSSQKQVEVFKGSIAVQVDLKNQHTLSEAKDQLHALGDLLLRSSGGMGLIAGSPVPLPD